MKLTIRFSGLFLYCKRPQALQVLAPATGMALPIPVMQHGAWLEVFDAYLTGSGAPSASRYTLLPLGGQSLRVATTDGTAADPTTLSPYLADLNVVTKSTPRAALFAATVQDARLNSRTVLTSGHQCGESARGHFHFNGRNSNLASEIGWEMHINGNRVDLEIASLDGSSKTTRTLQTDQSEMCLTVMHLPVDPATGGPMTGTTGPHQPGDISPHFVALYQFYDQPQAVELPVLDQVAPMGGIAGCASCGIVNARGGDPVTCVGGGA